MGQSLLRDEQTGGVVALVDHQGILVSGPFDLVENVVARLSDFQGARSYRATADIASLVTSAIAADGTSQDYVRLSPRSWDLLREHGAIPGEDGYFRMFVHDSARRIA